MNLSHRSTEFIMTTRLVGSLKKRWQERGRGGAVAAEDDDNDSAEEEEDEKEEKSGRAIAPNCLTPCLMCWNVPSWFSILTAAWYMYYTYIWCRLPQFNVVIACSFAIVPALQISTSRRPSFHSSLIQTVVPVNTTCTSDRFPCVAISRTRYFAISTKSLFCISWRYDKFINSWGTH